MKTLLARLDSETFILDVEPFSELPTGQCCNIKQIDERTLEVELSKKQSINNLFTELTAKGIEVNSMRNKANRLEELFIELVKKGKLNDK